MQEKTFEKQLESTEFWKKISNNNQTRIQQTAAKSELQLTSE